MKVWLDGEIQDAADARIPVDDHGLLYGDGVFEGLRVRAGRVFRLDRHLRRLENSARWIGLELPFGRDAFRALVLDTARAFGEPDAYGRLLVTRGSGPLGIDPASCERPRVICMVGRIALYDTAQRERGLELITSSYRRPQSDVLEPRVKSLNYLNSVLARQEARARGGDDALLLNAAGRVAEAAVANVFCVRDHTVATPPATEGALEGITREAVLELAAGMGFTTVERPLGRIDLMAADEVFLTGTGAGIAPVRALDGREIASGHPGPVTQKLTAAFDDLAQNEALTN